MEHELVEVLFVLLREGLVDDMEHLLVLGHEAESVLHSNVSVFLGNVLLFRGGVFGVYKLEGLLELKYMFY